MLLVAALMLTPAVTSAQTQKKQSNYFHCKVFLKDGKVVESYVTDNIYRSDSSVNVSDKPSIFSSKSTPYYNDQIDSLYTWMDDDPESVYHYFPVRVRYSYKDKADMPESSIYPSMVMRFYNGENVKGYYVWDALSGFRYLYKTTDMTAAHAYMPQKHRFSKSRKETMAEEFKKYPRFVNFINGLKSDAFEKQPAYILYQLDCIIKEDKANK